jgi:Calcium binding
VTAKAPNASKATGRFTKSYGRVAEESMPNTSRQKGRPSQLSKAKLDALVAEAISDAYDESEQQAGLLTMIQDNLQLPFETTVLGLPVRVQSVGFNKAGEIVAICVRDRHRQAIPIIDLPLPSPPPTGAEWIEAYRRWAGDGS